MRLSLKLTFEAREDLKDIWHYIAEDSNRKADRFIDKVYSKCVSVAESGFYGRSRPDLGKNVFSYPFHRYMIYFQRKKNTLYVLRIFRGVRKQPESFE